MEEDIFIKIYNDHHKYVYRYLIGLTSNHQTAEDLTQDICAALPAKLRTFRAEARFSTWLYRVTLNAAHDRRRRATTHSRAAAGWGDWEKGRQADISEAAEATDWLAQIMTRLPPDLRDTLALTLGEDLTQSEAAAILGLSEGTIAWRMSEVKKHLRQAAAEEARI